MYSFNKVVGLCPAAGTVGKSRKTTADDYITYPTRKLFNMATEAGFKCVDALQGPSIKPAYVPFARHMLTFDRHAEAAHERVPGGSPRFRLVITNGHNGLNPMMFIPAVYVPVHDVTLFASAFAVFHRDFTDEVKFEDLVRQAFTHAVDAEAGVMTAHRALLRHTISRRAASDMFRRIIGHHGGCTADVPPAQLIVNGMSAGNVAAAVLSGYVHGRFTSKTESGKDRAIYPSRAIVRIERAAFGAWFEACRVASLHPDVAPFNVTPKARDDSGTRRKSAPVILTGAVDAEAAD